MPGFYGRSLSNEAIVCLESVLLPWRLDAGERLARARALRTVLGAVSFETPDIDAMKREEHP